MIHKVKVIKVETSYVDDYEQSQTFHPAIPDWEEVDDDGLVSLREAIRYANVKSTGSRYCLITYNEDTKADMFRDAKAFVDARKKEREREEKAKEAKKDKAAQTDLARKKNQLEKLKKELGEID